MVISTTASAENGGILNILWRLDADFTQKYDFLHLTMRRLRAAKTQSANHRASIPSSLCIEPQDCGSP
jgi:hypothetical protein